MLFFEMFYSATPLNLLKCSLQNNRWNYPSTKLEDLS